MHSPQEFLIERMEDGREYGRKHKCDEEWTENEEDQDGRGCYQAEKEIWL